MFIHMRLHSHIKLAVPLLLFLIATVSFSMPAAQISYDMKQPDGTTIRVTKKGDERFHYAESEDGYPMVRDSNGFMRFADERGKPSKSRPSRKDEALNQLKRQLSTPIDPEAHAPTDSSDDGQGIDPQPLRMPSINANLKSGEKNALVVLVQFSDTKFSTENPAEVFDSLLNQEGYNKNENQGSVRDYYVTNSMGIFKPHFDVVGPITLSGSNYKKYGEHSANGTAGARIALKEALDTLKSQGFDFSKYDNNGDRYVDFVHMIYAGFGAHDSDQDSAIWPHKWIFASPYRIASTPKRLYVSDYSCNSELDGNTHKLNSSARNIFGVGNFIHEFSHLLGLPDMYSDNNQLFTPSSWDIMDMGAYNTTNSKGILATKPPYYSAFERLSLGWMTATDLNLKGNVKLSGIQNNVAVRLANPKNSNEMFLMEYRTKSGWDSGLPNHGLLIWHIDYKKSVWDSAAINTTAHQHVDIEEADGIASYNTRTGDPFPGAYRVKSFNKFITWDSTDLDVAISSISESRSYSYVSFNVNMDAEPDSLSLMEGEAEELMELPDTVLVDDPEEESSSSATPESSESQSTEEESPSSSSSESTSESSSSSSMWIEVTESLGGIQINSQDYGTKTLQVFSVNGQLLYQEIFRGNTHNVRLDKFRQPLLLSVTQKGKVQSRTLLIFGK